MRFPAGKVVATYSHTDEQVRKIARFALLTGALCGSVVTYVLFQIGR